MAMRCEQLLAQRHGRSWNLAWRSAGPERRLWRVLRRSPALLSPRPCAGSLRRTPARLPGRSGRGVPPVLRYRRGSPGRPMQGPPAFRTRPRTATPHRRDARAAARAQPGRRRLHGNRLCGHARHPRRRPHHRLPDLRAHPQRPCRRLPGPAAGCPAGRCRPGAQARAAADGNSRPVHGVPAPQPAADSRRRGPGHHRSPARRAARSARPRHRRGTPGVHRTLPYVARDIWRDVARLLHDHGWKVQIATRFRDLAQPCAAAQADWAASLAADLTLIDVCGPETPPGAAVIAGARAATARPVLAADPGGWWTFADGREPNWRNLMIQYAVGGRFATVGELATLAGL